MLVSFLYSCYYSFITIIFFSSTESHFYKSSCRAFLDNHVSHHLERMGKGYCELAEVFANWSINRLETTFIERVFCDRHYVKYVMWILSLNPHRRKLRFNGTATCWYDWKALISRTFRSGGISSVQNKWVECSLQPPLSRAVHSLHFRCLLLFFLLLSTMFLGKDHPLVLYSPTINLLHKFKLLFLF